MSAPISSNKVCEMCQERFVNEGQPSGEQGFCSICAWKLQPASPIITLREIDREIAKLEKELDGLNHSKYQAEHARLIINSHYMKPQKSVNTILEEVAKYRRVTSKLNTAIATTLEAQNGLRELRKKIVLGIPVHLSELQITGLTNSQARNPPRRPEHR